MANRRKWLTDFDAGLLAISRITKLAKFCTQQAVKQYFRQKIQYLTTAPATTTTTGYSNFNYNLHET